MTEIEAKVSYVKLARSLKTYGVSFFLVKVGGRLFCLSCFTFVRFACNGHFKNANNDYSLYDLKSKFHIKSNMTRINLKLYLDVISSAVVILLFDLKLPDLFSVRS